MEKLNILKRDFVPIGIQRTARCQMPQSDSTRRLTSGPFFENFFLSLTNICRRDLSRISTDPDPG
jgi:hypothetical protein